MPSYQAHLRQAQHNEHLLSDLVTNLSYKDWVATVAFYAAVHYVEAHFFNDASIVHTEATIPTGPDGRWQHSPHSWRQQLLRRYCTRQVWGGFRSLHNASYVARYLMPSGQVVAVTTDAQTHWTDNDTRDFVLVDLKNIKSALGFP